MADLLIQQTPEETLYARYEELGHTARDAEAERKQIKEQEIEPLLEAGVILGNATHCLVHEYRTRTDLDWAKAVAEKVLDLEALKPYIKVNVSRTLVSRKRDEDQREREREKNTAAAVALELRYACETLVSMIVDEPHSSALIPAITAAMEAIKKAQGNQS